MNKQSKGRRRIAGLCLVAVLGALLIAAVGGCANARVTRENYGRIEEGMSMEAVEDILGKPSRRHGRDYYYKGKYGTVKIEAKKGTVDEKKWKDKD